MGSTDQQELIEALRALSQSVGSLTTEVAALTSAANDLTAGIRRLSADLRSQTLCISEVMGQLTGSRWIIPVLIGLMMAFAGMVVGIILKR
jgi:hypothetical protein